MALDAGVECVLDDLVAGNGAVVLLGQGEAAEGGPSAAATHCAGVVGASLRVWISLEYELVFLLALLERGPGDGPLLIGLGVLGIIQNSVLSSQASLAADSRLGHVHLEELALRHDTLVAAHLAAITPATALATPGSLDGLAFFAFHERDGFGNTGK